uniref:Uncharacterized protein n=1 Tax=Arundo donax TaxID=35708 RepID=A0A0A9FAP8_ARUDO
MAFSQRYGSLTGNTKPKALSLEDSCSFCFKIRVKERINS